MSKSIFCHDQNMLPHLQKILAGEYNINTKAKNPIILDIGANIGAFTIWALEHKINEWIHPKLYCYEPSSENFADLKKNIEHLGYINVHLINKAVTDKEGSKVKLFHGKNNCGEKSLYDLGEQVMDFELVDTIHPSVLPKADIVKLDTEGSEVSILEKLNFEPDVFLIEYHSNSIRQQIDKLLNNYILISCEVRSYGQDKSCRGIVKYIHQRCFPSSNKN